MDPDTRRLMLFAGGLGGVLLTLIAASAVIGHHGSSEVPVVTADPRPVRVKPENPGGMKIDGAENDVFSAGSDTADSKLAPASENPDRKALRTAAASPPPVVATPPAASRPAAVALVPPKPVPAPAPVAEAHPHPADTHPADGHPSSAGATVQLAALTTEEAAHAEWQQMAKRMPDLLNGRQPIFARTDRDGHVFWRVRMAGFADAVQARGFCDRVRAKGGGCSVADF